MAVKYSFRFDPFRQLKFKGGTPPCKAIKVANNLATLPFLSLAGFRYLSMGAFVDQPTFAFDKKVQKDNERPTSITPGS